MDRRPAESSARSSPRNCSASMFPKSPGYYGEMVWMLMMLEQWLRAHRATSFSAGDEAPHQPTRTVGPERAQQGLSA